MAFNSRCDGGNHPRAFRLCNHYITLSGALKSNSVASASGDRCNAPKTAHLPTHLPGGAPTVTICTCPRCHIVQSLRPPPPAWCRSA